MHPVNDLKCDDLLNVKLYVVWLQRDTGGADEK
jgi:hypothetical protein